MTLGCVPFYFYNRNRIENTIMSIKKLCADIAKSNPWYRHQVTLHARREAAGENRDALPEDKEIFAEKEM